MGFSSEGYPRFHVTLGSCNDPLEVCLISHLATWEARCCTTSNKTFSGQVMGPVTSALLDGNTFQNLIRAPSGCGEQTLIRLGPLVYVAKYLKETGQMTGEKEKRIYDLIRQGVQHEMQYRKPGGGFAVWTSNRYPPSTWLTAFATKIFSQAREFNALGNDPSDVICKAVEWMAQQQKPSGAYQDPYKVHHREMTVRAITEPRLSCEWSFA